jgi:hypothetical protein
MPPVQLVKKDDVMLLVRRKSKATLKTENWPDKESKFDPESASNAASGSKEEQKHKSKPASKVVRSPNKERQPEPESKQEANNPNQGRKREPTAAELQLCSETRAT